MNDDSPLPNEEFQSPDNGNGSTIKDPTWASAMESAKSFLNVPYATNKIIRQSFLNQLDNEEFVKLLALSAIQARCLIKAASLPQQNKRKETNREQVLQAIEKLGLPVSSVVMATHLISSLLLKRPSTLQKKIVQEMMTHLEIGAIVGKKIPLIGQPSGMLAGLARYAGLGAYLLTCPSSEELITREMNEQRVEQQQYLALTPHQPYQLTSLILQLLGFGKDIAIGLGFASGKLKLEHIEFDQQTQKFKAALLWIEALRRGRSYPADPEMRLFFPEIAPAKEGAPDNLTLSVLYTEVSKLKNEGSIATWHL